MKKVLVLLAVLVWVPFALADTFTLQSYTVTPHTTDPGLVINWAPVAGTPSFDLSVGQSATFDLFQIWTDESSVNSGEDTIPYDIDVQFLFNPPPSPSGDVNGDTSGVRAGLFGVIQYGQVSWNGPAVVDFGNGGQYTFALSDETFNGGFFGLDPGPGNGATVKGTLTYNSASVPEPASLLLLGSGLIGLGAIRRQRSRA